jgi:hypothetical protein
MIRPAVAALVSFLALGSPSVARAQANGDVAQADALFSAAKRLRDSGRFTEACAEFAKSARLAPGVGVTLYLAECYERVGWTASAWGAFRDAERLASEKGDKRADVARAHAEGLEPKLNRIEIAAAAGSGEVRIDGGPPLVPAQWMTGAPVDPGDHRVTFRAAGSATRSLTVHIDAATLAVVVRIEPALPARQRPPIPAPPPSVELTGARVKSSSIAVRHYAEVGLVGAGAVAIGVGAALLGVKNRSMNADGTYVEKQAATGSAVAFSAGGAAIVSAIVLYLATPNDDGGTGLLVLPSVMTGGGGAFVRGTF